MTSLTQAKEVKIGIDFGSGITPVGRLVSHERTLYFEYDRSFIKRGLEISPLRLPLKAGVVHFDPTLFEGLPGVFNDSLPDGWGRLLFDRFARSQGIAPSDITPLDRLIHIGTQGMGALVFEPAYPLDTVHNEINLDHIARQAHDVLEGASDDVLEELIALSGSSAGARPKALIGLNEARTHIIQGREPLPADYTPWIVKFANSQDGEDAGAIEYVYAQMAVAAGITLPEHHLFPAQHGAGYFAVKRFDREGDKRIHTHTASGLLHSDFRTPSLDYEDLMALTSVVTRDIRQVERMYQLAVFNVLAHNRDDHAKNFSFLMDEQGQWLLSPAYDLTFSSGPHGEQSTMVMGEGRAPTIEDLIRLGEEANISLERIHDIIGNTQASLARWPELAKRYGVNERNIKLIKRRLLIKG